MTAVGEAGPGERVSEPTEVDPAIDGSSGIVGVAGPVLAQSGGAEGESPSGARSARTSDSPVSPDGEPIAVVPPEFVEYTVRAGDTLAAISERVYGTRSHASVVGRANPFMDPNRLKVGRVIRVPRDPKNVQGRPLLRPGAPQESEGVARRGSGASEGASTYVVRPGDTLSGIAQEVYGTSVLGTLLYESNRAVLRSPDELKVGMKLQIPPRPEGEPTGGAR